MKFELYVEFEGNTGHEVEADSWAAAQTLAEEWIMKGDWDCDCDGACAEGCDGDCVVDVAYGLECDGERRWYGFQFWRQR